MNPVPNVPPAPRRRIWPWVLGICLTPFLALGLAVASYVTLDRDASTLRRHVMRATNADWNTKVQISVGGATIGTVRTGLLFADQKEIEEARFALRAVKHASVGVYELASGSRTDWSSAAILRETDRAMQGRGWTRLVGVAGTKETVMVYTSDNLRDDGPMDLCIAVLDGRELVVVSARIEPDALGRLVERHAGRELTASLRRHARL